MLGEVLPLKLMDDFNCNLNILPEEIEFPYRNMWAI